MSTELTRQLASGQVKRTKVSEEDRENYIHAFLLGTVLPDVDMGSNDRVRLEQRVDLIRKLWHP